MCFETGQLQDDPKSYLQKAAYRSKKYFGFILCVRACVRACILYPLLGGLVAEVQGSWIPVYSYVSISYRSSVFCALYRTASAEPANTQMCSTDV